MKRPWTIYINNISWLQVKFRDSTAAVCPECGAIFTKYENPWWSHQKSKFIHESGTGHKMIYAVEATEYS